MRLIRLAIPLLAASAFLTGCPPTYPKCNSDEHCQERGEVCVQGQCQECATDENCKPGFVCQANKCVPKPECASDAECGEGRKCQGGRCVTATTSRAPGTCTTDGDCPSGEECQEGKCGAKRSASCDWSPVTFEFNEHRLSSGAQSRLDQLAECIKKENAKVTLEGHADERGTEEYNLQLSNKRAASVKRYLANLGVADRVLETVGFGENRPTKQGAGEDAWSANRRVEFSKK